MSAAAAAAVALALAFAAAAGLRTTVALSTSSSARGPASSSPVPHQPPPAVVCATPVAGPSSQMVLAPGGTVSSLPSWQCRGFHPMLRRFPHDPVLDIRVTSVVRALLAVTGVVGWIGLDKISLLGVPGWPRFNTRLPHQPGPRNHSLALKGAASPKSGKRGNAHLWPHARCAAHRWRQWPIRVPASVCSLKS